MEEKGEVVSFKISYWSGMELEILNVEGKNIPDSICAQIGLYNIDQMVFITDIQARIKNGSETVYLNSLNLIPVLKNED